jgi:hypothetical protein
VSLGGGIRVPFFFERDIWRISKKVVVLVVGFIGCIDDNKTQAHTKTKHAQRQHTNFTNNTNNTEGEREIGVPYFALHISNKLRLKLVVIMCAC